MQLTNSHKLFDFDVSHNELKDWSPMFSSDHKNLFIGFFYCGLNESDVDASGVSLKWNQIVIIKITRSVPIGIDSDE